MKQFFRLLTFKNPQKLPIPISSKTTPKTKTTSSNIDDLLSLIDRASKDKTTGQSNYSFPFIRIVSNGYLGSPKSFLLFMGEQKFLFNCAESTSRLLGDMGELNQIQHLNILLTRSTWNSCFSGLMSMIYSLRYQKKHTSICFHAPFNTPGFLYDTFHLLKLESIKFEQHEYETPQVQVDERLFSSHGLEIKHMRILTVYGYLVKIKSVNSETKKLLVIDLPDLEHLDKFIEQSRTLVESNVDFFMHLSPGHLLSNSKYVKRVREISSEQTRHFVFDENQPNLVSKNIYLQQTFLNQLNSYVFPLLKFNNYHRSLRLA